jgi:hypothetical protein
MGRRVRRTLSWRHLLRHQTEFHWLCLQLPASARALRLAVEVCPFCPILLAVSPTKRAMYSGVSSQWGHCWSSISWFRSLPAVVDNPFGFTAETQAWTCGLGNVGANVFTILSFDLTSSVNPGTTFVFDSALTTATTDILGDNSASSKV